jgi:glycerol-3-phosphate dehydrogenase
VTDDSFSRDQQIHRLRHEAFDVAVIGGGINGAAVARDAAMRGLRVALIDRGDFAGQTSSRSSKLIHGGLRYLPQGRLRLVYEALSERERLLRLTAPHLVRPIRFLFPVYDGLTASRLALGAGLFIYDLLARTPAAQRHETLNAAGVIALEPDLARAGLRGGAAFCDAHCDDARLTLENVLDCTLHGAAAANYLALEGFEKNATSVKAAQVRDVLSGERFAVRARVYVNATGPWIDDVRKMDEPDAGHTIRLTKGVHLILEARRLPVNHSLVLSDGRGRIVFLIREQDSLLLGTTDTDFSGERGQLRILPDDVDYLLAVVARTIPGAALGPHDIVGGFAGLRTRVGTQDAQSPSRVSREELIITSASGMISVAGGKLTTHRRIGERVVNLICRELGKSVRPSPTLKTPLPGARPPREPLPNENAVAPEVRLHLASRYGTRKDLLEVLIRERPQLARPLLPGCQVLAAEAVHAVRSEMAVRLEDFMVRRTTMARSYPAHAEAAAPAAARLMGSELGWNRAREESEIGEFTASLRASRII